MVTFTSEQFGIAVTLETRIPEFLGSNLGRETDCTDLDFRRFPQSFKANAGMVTSIRQRPYTSRSITFHQSSHHPTLSGLDTENGVK